jgi:hypothetical protein
MKSEPSGAGNFMIRDPDGSLVLCAGRAMSLPAQL